jgi:anti-sigma factor RsiW
MNAPIDEKQIREYLLGGLTPELREQIEARMFEDDEFADFLREMEADLLDRFTAGTLTEADRGRVAILTANPAWASKLAVSKWIATQSASTQIPQASRKTTWWLGWAAALVVASLAGWMARENGRLRALVAKPTAASIIASISLTAGTQRGSSDRTIAIPASAEVLRIEAPGESGYKEYMLSVEGAGASFTVPAQPRGDVAVAWVPSAMLPSGRYDFLLKGQRGGASELLGSFSVRIERN